MLPRFFTPQMHRRMASWDAKAAYNKAYHMKAEVKQRRLLYKYRMEAQTDSRCGLSMQPLAKVHLLDCMTLSPLS